RGSRIRGRPPMPSPPPGQAVLGPGGEPFSRHAVRALRAGGARFMVGGAYALAYMTGVVRHTKDFDLFVRPEDSGHVLELLAGAGYSTELTFGHWLGKAFHGDEFCDV